VELQDVHVKLAKLHPENYGTLSAIVLHLMRHVMVTPSNVPGYVVKALQILNYDSVVDRFGMFFVDDLDPSDMERLNINLGAKDGDQIKREYKTALKAIHGVKPKRPQRNLALASPYASTQYPWGEAVSWSLLQQLCKDCPTELLRPFDFANIDLSPDRSEAVENLFITFTRQAWLGVQESFVPAALRPDPADLEEAINVWTCQRVLQLLPNRSTFLPSTFGLEGAPKRKGQGVSFESLRVTFFPLQGATFKASIWKDYASGSGYIKTYWDYIENNKDEPDAIEELHSGLEEVFRHLQCLPQMQNDHSIIWHGSDGSVCFLTNSLYYRVKSISSRERAGQEGAQRPQVSSAELQRRLEPNRPANNQLKRRKLEERSRRSKDFREPPRKQRRIQKPPPSSTTSASRRSSVVYSDSEQGASYNHMRASARESIMRGEGNQEIEISDSWTSTSSFHSPSPSFGSDEI
jgi:hypothetical protein